MADVKPGASTSEYKVTLINTILSVLAVVVGGLLSILQGLRDVMPAAGWIGGAISIVGLISGALVAMGYQKARAAVKIAGSSADAADSVTKTS